MNRVVLGRWINRSEYSVSSTDICRWVYSPPLLDGSSRHTEMRWVIPSFFFRSGHWAAAKLEERHKSIFHDLSASRMDPLSKV